MQSLCLPDVGTCRDCLGPSHDPVSMWCRTWISADHAASRRQARRRPPHTACRTPPQVSSCRNMVHRHGSLAAAQGAVELSDEGAAFMAEGFQLLQGPSEAPMTAAQCKFADLDLIVSFWLVRPDSAGVVPGTQRAASAPMIVTARTPCVCCYRVQAMCHLRAHVERLAKWQPHKVDSYLVDLWSPLQGNRHVQQGLLRMGADVEGSPADLHLRACIMACFRVRRQHVGASQIASHWGTPDRLASCRHIQCKTTALALAKRSDHTLDHHTSTLGGLAGRGAGSMSTGTVPCVAGAHVAVERHASGGVRAHGGSDRRPARRPTAPHTGAVPVLLWCWHAHHLPCSRPECGAVAQLAPLNSARCVLLVPPCTEVWLYVGARLLCTTSLCHICTAGCAGAVAVPAAGDDSGLQHDVRGDAGAVRGAARRPGGGGGHA